MATNVSDEISWFIENFEEIWHDQVGKFDILNLSNEKLSSILSSDKLNVKKEELVWNVIFDWVCKDSESKRIKHLPDLVRDCLRIGRLPTDFIQKKIFESNLFKVLCSEDQLDLKFFINNALKDDFIKQTITDGFNLPYSPTIKNFRPRETKQLLVCISASVEFFDYQRNSWLSSSFELPTKQTNFQLEQLDNDGNMLYAFGGRDDSVTNKVWSLDLSQPSSEWIKMKSLNQKRTDFSSVVFNGNIYAFGGLFENNHFKTPLNSCERWDGQPVNDWSPIESMKIARYKASAAVYKDCIYIAGGRNEKDEVEQSVETYDPQLNKWTLIERMTSPRYSFALTTFAGCLWAIGGHDGDQALSSFECFDWSTNRWKPKTELQKGRFDHAAIDFNGNLYVVGGSKQIGLNDNLCDPIQVVERYIVGKGWYESSQIKKTHKNAKLIIVSNANSKHFTANSSQNIVNEDKFQEEQSNKNNKSLDSLISPSCTYTSLQVNEGLFVCIDMKICSIEFYNQTSNRWQASPLLFNFPTKQDGFKLELISDKNIVLYAFGGQVEKISSNKVWSRDLSQPTSEWIEMKSMKQCRAYFSSVVLNGFIYALGGWSFDNALKLHYLSSCERYDREKNDWEPITRMNIGRHYAFSTVHNGCIYIAGGYNKNSIIEQSMEKYDPQSDSWSLVKQMSTGRTLFTLTSFSGRLWAIGGFDGKQALSTVESYDAVSDTWQEEAHLNEARHDHAAIEFNGQLYVVGGYKNDTVEKYVHAKEWENIEKLEKSLYYPNLFVVPESYSEILLRKLFQFSQTVQ